MCREVNCPKTSSYKTHTISLSLSLSLPLSLTNKRHSYHDWRWPQDTGVPFRSHSFQYQGKTIFGLTANILIQVAILVFKRTPEFEYMAPGQLSNHDLNRHIEQRYAFKEQSSQKVKL